MKVKIGTFNLFQFAKPPYSFYTRKEKFTQENWEKKTTWIKEQITKMDCDIIGFQEVFSKDALEELVKDLGFEYFLTVDDAKLKDTIFTSTTVALASKYPIIQTKEVKTHIPSIKKHNYKGYFSFSRKPIKAKIKIQDQELWFYVCHLKSNRLNEFEYVFTKDDILENKLDKINLALSQNYSEALKQRLCEASSLFFDIKKEKNIPKILVCDLNDKEFSITIDALTNDKYHDIKRKESFILKDAFYQYKKKETNPHPEKKEKKRTPTSHFQGKGNTLDYIFISKEFDKANKNNIAYVNKFEIFDEHLQKNPDGSILQSDHAQVVCELEFKMDDF